MTKKTKIKTLQIQPEKNIVLNNTTKEFKA